MLPEHMGGGRRKLAAAGKNPRVFHLGRKALGLHLPNPTCQTSSCFPGELLQLVGP